MEDKLDAIIRNAQQGTGPCSGCPAQQQMEGRLANPGLGNPDGDIIFVTEEPRHLTNWDAYETWAAYNEEWWPRIQRARGGQFVSNLLSGTKYSLNDIWFTDSIKCPTKPDSSRDIPGVETETAFSHCTPYLRTEIEHVDPEAVVTLGRGATVRTLQVISSEPELATQVRVTKEYGLSDFDTDYPVVISLHWAQRTVPQDEWVPVVRDAIADIIQGKATLGTEDQAEPKCGKGEASDESQGEKTTTRSLADQLTSVEIGDKLLYNNRKVPLRVTDLSPEWGNLDGIEVTGPQGGQYILSGRERKVKSRGAPYPLRSLRSLEIVNDSP